MHNFVTDMLIRTKNFWVITAAVIAEKKFKEIL